MNAAQTAATFEIQTTPALALRSAAAPVPQDSPVASSLTREGAAALVNALALLLGDDVVPPPPAKTPAPRQRARVKRSPRPAVSATAARAATPVLNAHQRQVLVWMAQQRHQRMTYFVLGEWTISSEGRLLGTTRSSTVRLLEKRGMIQQLRGEGERRYLTEAGLRVARAQMAEAEAA